MKKRERERDGKGWRVLEVGFGSEALNRRCL